MARRWQVEYDEAYETWVSRRRPTPDEELALMTFFDRCAQAGPPHADDADLQGNLTVVGPVGTRIYFRRFADASGPAAGYMLVMRID